ncbi:LysR substrate-binding domain-containing protein, partial [Pantoea sp. Ft+CA_17]|uniref:LysR substrate-binding domain-containing protein n=1 Tax=Pantoea sp. Ft+CA_17 TaxID=2929508 RepID=UPI00356A0C41
MLMDWFSSHGMMPRRINTCNSIAAIEKIAVWGKSVSVLPTCVIQGEIDRGTVAELDVEPVLPKQPVSAVFP